MSAGSLWALATWRVAQRYLGRSGSVLFPLKLVRSARGTGRTPDTLVASALGVVALSSTTCTGPLLVSSGAWPAPTTPLDSIAGSTEARLRIDRVVIQNGSSDRFLLPVPSSPSPPEPGHLAHQDPVMTKIWAAIPPFWSPAVGLLCCAASPSEQRTSNLSAALSASMNHQLCFDTEA